MMIFARRIVLDYIEIGGESLALYYSGRSFTNVGSWSVVVVNRTLLRRGIL
jgi:hypothetical protein